MLFLMEASAAAAADLSTWPEAESLAKQVIPEFLDMVCLTAVVSVLAGLVVIVITGNEHAKIRGLFSSLF